MRKRAFLFLAVAAVLLAVSCNKAVSMLATYKIAYYTLAISHDPNDADAYDRRGDVYLYNKGDYDRAIADYTQALKLDPNHVGAFICLAIAHQHKGNFICFGPVEISNMLNRRGNAYSDNGDYDRAITTYEEALQFYPYNYHTKQGLENARRLRGMEE